jgi:hypothetical protein
MSDSLVVRATCSDCGDEIDCSVSTYHDELVVAVKPCSRCTEEAASKAVAEAERAAGL